MGDRGLMARWKVRRPSYTRRLGPLGADFFGVLRQEGARLNSCIYYDATTVVLRWMLLVFNGT
jgi:hypothetical protein